MNLPHHRHPPGRDLEWILPILIVFSAADVVLVLWFFLRRAF